MIPIGNVDRIMKEALSKDCNLPPSSTAFVQACLSKFITRLTTGALAKCGRENRKSITADDLVWALKLSSEFCHYAPIARAYTQRHRAIEATSRLSKRQGDQSLNFNPTLPIFAAAPHLTSGSAMPEHLQTSKNASAIRSAARAYATVQARGKTRMPFNRGNSGAASQCKRTAILEANALIDARPEYGVPETLAEQAAWSAVNQGAWHAETPSLLSKSPSSTSSLDLSAPSVHDDSMNKKDKSPTYDFLVCSSNKRASAPCSSSEEDETAVELSSGNEYRAQKKSRNKLVFPSQPV
eukprot:Tamp_19083.p1 GENE.Tamp_19083~~Tamp_19083.p1  ORF type:complete len:296 (+),score=42.69 Tamp_19083:318-1205(+)